MRREGHAQAPGVDEEPTAAAPDIDDAPTGADAHAWFRLRAEPSATRSASATNPCSASTASTDPSSPSADSWSRNRRVSKSGDGA